MTQQQKPEYFRYHKWIKEKHQNGEEKVIGKLVIGATNEVDTLLHKANTQPDLLTELRRILIKIQCGEACELVAYQDEIAEVIAKGANI